MGTDRPSVNGQRPEPLSAGGGNPGAGHHAQEDAGRVALVCHRDSAHAEMTFWRNRAEAEEALRSLVPCDSGCANAHALVFVDAGRIRTVTYPAQPVLIATVVPGSWRIDGSRRLASCPFCGGEHSHSKLHVGTVRASGCLRGFYEIRNPEGDKDNGDE